MGGSLTSHDRRSPRDIGLTVATGNPPTLVCRWVRASRLSLDAVCGLARNFERCLGFVLAKPCSFVPANWLGIWRCRVLSAVFTKELIFRIFELNYLN